MEWTLKQFFADGGTTKFVDRLAGALGIHASEIKIVSVYEGSVILNYDIVADDDDTSALQSIEDTQTRLFATGAMSLGAPILDVSSVNAEGSANKAIITNGQVTAAGYDPIIITKTAAKTGGSVTTFAPKMPLLNKTSSFYKDVLAPTRPSVSSGAKDKGQAKFLIIAVALGVAVLLGVIVCARMWYFQSKKDYVEAQRIHQQIAADQKKKQDCSEAVELHQLG